jgi:hypothetical protein
MHRKFVSCANGAMRIVCPKNPDQIGEYKPNTGDDAANEPSKYNWISMHG